MLWSLKTISTPPPWQKSSRFGMYVLRLSIVLSVFPISRYNLELFWRCCIFCSSCNCCFVKEFIGHSYKYVMQMSFPHSWLITGFVFRLARRVSLMKQELLTIPEHLSLPPGVSWVRVTRSLGLCGCFVDRCLSFFFWPLCCMFFFDIQILITPLVSSNSS